MEDSRIMTYRFSKERGLKKENNFLAGMNSRQWHSNKEDSRRIMKFCCGSSFSTNLYAKFEAGVFRRVPSSDDIVESIRWAQSVDFGAMEFAILTRRQLDSTFHKAGIEKIADASRSLGIQIPHLSAPFLSGIFPKQRKLVRIKAALFHLCAGGC